MVPSRNYSSVEVKVGLFVAFCLALFVAMLATYGKLAPVWRGRTELRVAFSNVGGLSPDAPVRYNGVEVGRVKWMHLMHLDKENLERLPALSKRDLDNLPLWQEATLKELREASEEDFDVRCRRAMQNRTMIELNLEVLQEGDAKRYRLDDTVRIVSTIFGDCAVEIVSGNGAILQAGTNTVIVGTSGDFFSNLAKSMGDVKEILGGVTDVVGAQERHSFERASSRLANITGRMDKMSTIASERSEVTTKRIDALGGHINKTLTRSSEALESIEPQARRSFDAMKANLTNAQERMQAVQDEAAAAFKGIAADFKIVRDDVSTATEQSKPHFEVMTNSIRDVYDRLGGLSARLDGMKETAGALVVQSEPDLARTLDAMRNSLTNLKYTGEAANENKDLMIGNRDLGEYESASALDIYRRLTAVTRHITGARAEVQEVEQFVARQPKSAANGPAQVLFIPEGFKVRSGATIEKLALMRAPLARLLDDIEDKMLPNYERKKSAWSDDTAPR